MLYTIGYSRRTARNILAIATELDAVVIDVRGSPRSRKADFNRPALERVMGARYVWRGETLGNYAPNVVTPEGLRWLEQFGDKRHAILMCMEGPPGDCHRHHMIARPLGGVCHIFDGALIDSAELQRAIDEDDDYALLGELPSAQI